MTVLALDDVTQVFGGVVRALNGVSLAVGEGERIGIVGESGSGKTTLARIALGLTKPTAGKVTLLGRDVSAQSRDDRRYIHRNVQMVFQDPLSSLNPRKSVRQIIALPLEAQRIGSTAERGRRVEQLMDSVGLPARHLDSWPSQLSGGQRQRVGIARALAISPKLLFLDEPTASLDVSVQARVLELLAALQAELKIAQAMISHNLGVIRHAADRVAVMYLGQVVEQAPTARLYAAPAHPYTQALFAAVPSVGARKRAAGSVTRARGEVASATNIPPGCPFHPRCPQALDRCRVEVPRVSTVAPGHTVRCHLHG
jgi:oligopeptide/dipeptide ABC transporter ATP-binding protein